MGPGFPWCWTPGIGLQKLGPVCEDVKRPRAFDPAPSAGMHLLVPLCLALLATQGPESTTPPPPVKDLVAVEVPGPAAAALLFQTATDPDDHHGVVDGVAWILADDAEQARLRAQGWRLWVLQEDLAGFYAARAAADPARAAAAGSMGGFRTLAEILQEMDRLAATYPGIVSPRFSLGRSIEGRDIWAMRISDNPGVHEPGEPVAWFDALHHAREPMSGESMLLFADWLASRYGTDPVVTRLVETREILVVPCANPDGYEYNRQTNPNGGGLWRKNRRDNGGGVYGVDLNRNYGWEWGAQWNGSSGNPASSTYRGTAPFSEPEVAALRDALLQAPPGMSISAHTYSNLWLFPWSYGPFLTPDDGAFRYYGGRFAANNGWTYGATWQVLYEANGVSMDWHYGQLGTFAFSPEIGGFGDGFWPSPSRIPALFQAVLPAYVMTAMWSGGYAERAAETWSEVQGDGDPWLEPGETWDVVLEYGNAGVLPVGLQLQATSPGPDVVVLQGAAAGTIPVRGTASLPPLRLQFAAGAPVGTALPVDLALTWEGTTSTEVLELRLGQPRLFAHDDMETGGYGWQVSNATNWSWERAVPQQTTSGGQVVQPGEDNPAGSGTRCQVTGAAAGASVGANDVDGTTRLVSPRILAGGLDNLELAYARWFANLPGQAQDDELLVEVSADDGVTWVTVERTPNDNQWRTLRFALEELVPLTDELRLRFTAADDPNNDLTEACLDDVQLLTRSALPVLGLWGEVDQGRDVVLFVDGPASATWRILWSFQAGAGVPTAGMDGLLYLQGTVRELARGTTDPAGQARVPVTIPTHPALAGRTAYLQAALDEGGPEGAWSTLLAVRFP